MRAKYVFFIDVGDAVVAEIGLEWRPHSVIIHF